MEERGEPAKETVIYLRWRLVSDMVLDLWLVYDLCKMIKLDDLP